MNRYSRREFAAALAAIGLTPASFVLSRNTIAATEAEVFSHGVASGDPLHDRVILWTKVTPKSFDRDVEGRWSIASDTRFTKVIHKGSFKTGVQRDFTVKID